MHRTHNSNLIRALMKGQYAAKKCKLSAKCCASGTYWLGMPVIPAWPVLQMYRAWQKRIAQKALAALSWEACGLLQEVQEQSQKLVAVNEGHSSPAKPSADADGASHAPAVSKLEAAGSVNPSKGTGYHTASLTMQQGQHADSTAATVAQSEIDRTEGHANGRADCAQAYSGTALEALQGEHAWQTGVMMNRSCREGEVVARQPLSSGFMANSRGQLVLDLAAARCTTASHAGKCMSLTLHCVPFQSP